ncbi:MAG: hypothetical protein IJL87_01110 [Clostridia bacterium]|nr:hypothetical protein [Clostridia bacterium]
MTLQFPTGPGISYAIASAFAVVGEKSYPIQFNKNVHFLPPGNFAAMKGWLRIACADPQSPVNKDPLDQYLYELCGTVFDRLDFVLVNICEIHTGPAVEEVRQRVLNNPMAFIKANQPDNVSNFLAETVLADRLQGVSLLYEMTFDMKLKRMSVCPGCAEVETVGGYHYIKNPNPNNLGALMRICKQKASEQDHFNRLKNQPYDLLVNTRDYRGTYELKVPRVAKAYFEVDVDGTGNTEAIADLVDDQKLIVRRIYTGNGSKLQLFDYKGRCVGGVPQVVCEWMVPALEGGVAAVSTSKVGDVKLGVNRATLSFKVNVHLVVLDREAFVGLVTYHIIKNFDYPDLKPIIVTARQGLPLVPWLQIVYNLYTEYQEQPEKLALPRELQQCWKKAAQFGLISEEMEEQVPPDNDTALPSDLFSADVSSENAIAHYDAMLGDPTIIKQDIDRARILILKGKACADNARFAEATQSFVAAEGLFRKGMRMDPVYLAYIYISLAKIDIASDLNEESVKHLSRASAVLERERRHGRRSVLGLLISVYILGGDQSVLIDNRELAVDAYSSAIELVERYHGEALGDDEQTAELYEKRAELCVKEGYTLQAIRDFFKAIEIFECRLIYKKPIDRTVVVNAYRKRADLFEKNGFPELSISDKKRAAQLVKRIKRDNLNAALEQTRLAVQEKQTLIDTVLRGLSGEGPAITLPGVTETVGRKPAYTGENGSAPLPARFTSSEDMFMEQEEKFRFENYSDKNKGGY